MRNLKLISNLHCVYGEAGGARCVSLDNDTGLVYIGTDSELLSFHPADGKVCLDHKIKFIM